MEILSIGNVFESLSIMADSFCEKDGEIVANKLNRRISGSAIVVASMAAYLEESANVILKGGKSSSLEKYVDLLESRNIRVTMLPENEINTLVTVYDKDYSRQCYSYIPNSISGNDLKEVDFTKYDLVFFCSLPYSSISDLYICNKTIYSTCVVVLPNGFLPTYFKDGIFQMRPDFLFMNEGELTNLYSTEIKCDSSIQDLIIQLRIKETNVIVTRGQKGVVGCVNKNFFENPVHEIHNIVHPGGAGDSFATGFMISFAKGGSISECCNVGHRCASKMLAVFNTEEFLRGNDEIVWKNRR